MTRLIKQKSDFLNKIFKGKNYISRVRTILKALGLLTEVAQLVNNAEFEERRHLLIWLLQQAGEIEGRTRFQKMVFLGQKELGLPKLFAFKKYHYGPYSQDLADTIQSLVLQGDIAENISIDGDVIEYRYKLRDKDMTGLENEFQISVDAIETLKRLRTVPLNLILTYVYENYCPKQGVEIRVQV